MRERNIRTVVSVTREQEAVSVSGRSGPMWWKDGGELYFVSEDHTLMAVSVTTGPASLEFSTPTRLFMQKDLVGGLTSGGRVSYAPSSDGQRFLVLVVVENDRPESLHLIHNWKP
jgi:hypothetical protein